VKQGVHRERSGVEQQSDGCPPDLRQFPISRSCRGVIAPVLLILSILRAPVTQTAGLLV